MIRQNHKLKLVNVLYCAESDLSKRVYKCLQLAFLPSALQLSFRAASFRKDNRPEVYGMDVLPVVYLSECFLQR